MLEFSLIAVVLFPFLFALVIFMFNLAQSWSLDQAVNTMGRVIATTGTYSATDFVNHTNNLGFPVQPSSDGLIITVYDPAGTPLGTYSWTNGSDGDRTFTVSYGDFVTIDATKDLGRGEFASVLVDLLPTSKASWSGIAQCDTGGLGAPCVSGQAPRPADVGQATANPGTASEFNYL